MAQSLGTNSSPWLDPEQRQWITRELQSKRMLADKRSRCGKRSSHARFGRYDLVGTILTLFEGVQYTGVTNQHFTVSFDDNHIVLKDLQGETSLTATVVPETRCRSLSMLYSTA